MSKYGVFSGPSFPHSDWIRNSFPVRIFPHLDWISGQFSRSVLILLFMIFSLYFRIFLLPLFWYSICFPGFYLYLAFDVLFYFLEFPGSWYLGWILWIFIVSTLFIYQLHLKILMTNCFLIIFDVRFSTHFSFLYCFIDSFLSSYLFFNACLFFTGPSWYFLFLAFKSLCHFADNCSLFNEHLMALLAVTVQSTFINCIWKYKVSQ